MEQENDFTLSREEQRYELCERMKHICFQSQRLLNVLCPYEARSHIVLSESASRVIGPYHEVQSPAIPTQILHTHHVNEKPNRKLGNGAILRIIV
jgi:hypothetical protein